MVKQYCPGKIHKGKSEYKKKEEKGKIDKGMDKNSDLIIQKIKFSRHSPNQEDVNYPPPFDQIFIKRRLKQIQKSSKNI